MTWMSDAQEWLTGQMQLVAGHSCVYRQPGRRPIICTAVRQVEDVQIIDADGLPSVVRRVSFMVPTSELGGAVPMRGDRITETVGTVSREWEVAPRGDSAVSAFDDPDETTTRIFVIEVE